MVLSLRPVWLERPWAAWTDLPPAQVGGHWGHRAVAAALRHAAVKDLLIALVGRPVRGPRADWWLNTFRHLAEDMGEWAVWFLAAMLVITLWQRFPYPSGAICTNCWLGCTWCWRFMRWCWCRPPGGRSLRAPFGRGLAGGGAVRSAFAGRAHWQQPPPRCKGGGCAGAPQWCGRAGMPGAGRLEASGRARFVFLTLQAGEGTTPSRWSTPILAMAVCALPSRRWATTPRDWRSRWPWASRCGWKGRTGDSTSAGPCPRAGVGGRRHWRHAVCGLAGIAGGQPGPGPGGATALLRAQRPRGRVCRAHAAAVRAIAQRDAAHSPQRRHREGGRRCTAGQRRAPGQRVVLRAAGLWAGAARRHAAPGAQAGGAFTRSCSRCAEQGAPSSGAPGALWLSGEVVKRGEAVFTGMPCASTSRKPGAASTWPMRVTGVRFWVAASATAARCWGGR